MPTVLGKAPKAGRPKRAAAQDDKQLLASPSNEGVGDHSAAVALVGVPTAWPFPESADPLDTLTAAGAPRALQLALWKIRHDYPEGLQITPQDIAKMAACTEYLKVQPQARVWRRPAQPPHDGVPAAGNRRAIPPSAGMPAAPFVVIQLVDEAGNAFRLVENNEEDNATRIATEKRNQARTAMPGLVGAVRSALARGETSDGMINELCEAAMAIARMS